MPTWAITPERLPPKPAKIGIIYEILQFLEAYLSHLDCI